MFLARGTLFGLLMLLPALMSPSQVDEAASAAAREEVRLPVYPLRIEILNSVGEPLLTRSPPSLAFKELTLSVLVDEASPSGYAVPTTLVSAADQLRDMLPADYLERLLTGIDHLQEFGAVLDDPAVDERVMDLALFLQEIWGLSERDHPLARSLPAIDPGERLVLILNQAKR